MVLDEHQRHIDDGRAVLDAHGVDVRTDVGSSFLLQQVGPEDHRQVGCRHLVAGDLDGEHVTGFKTGIVELLRVLFKS